MTPEPTLRHLFISPKGEMLARWHDAFPDAVCLSVEAPFPVICRADVVWVRLDAVPNAGKTASLVKSLGAAGKSVIALSDMPNEDEGLEVFSQLARGYTNSHATPELLRQIASVVTQGGIWIGEGLMQRLVLSTRKMIGTAAVSSMPESTTAKWNRTLTQREAEIAMTVANGMANAEIAREFGISERTVKAHVSAILEKLQLRDRLQLALAVRESV